MDETLTMATSDAAEMIRIAARKLPDIDEGMSCSQSSFKRNGVAFLYIGEQGGRYKAMFKLKNSLAKAKQLANDFPDDFQVGGNNWVTTRFSNDCPMPAELWKEWLEESFNATAKG